MAYPPLNPAEAAKARMASRRMSAAIRRGSINSYLLGEWKRVLDFYRHRSDRMSVLDFLYEYGDGINAYCRPSRFDRREA